MPGWNDVIAICLANNGTLKASDTLRIFFNQPPVANAGGPYEQFIGTPLQFDGSLSRDPESMPLQFNWDLGDGTQATGAQPTHTYSTEGIFTVTLTVADGDGCTATDTTTATIRPKSIQIAVQILSPADSTVFFCSDSVEVLASVSAVGNNGLPPIARCKINGQTVALDGETFGTKLFLQQSPFRVTARCQTSDGQTAADSIVVFNKSESEIPTCKFTKRAGVVEVTAVDEGSGIASIKAIKLWNSKLVLAPFAAGSKRVDFRVEAIDPDQSLGFDIEITDRCGNILLCDPVFMEVAAAGGRLAYSIPFPPADRYLTIENNGLSWLAFELNGQRFTAGNISISDATNFSLPAYGTITIDLGKHLDPIENILHVTIPNEPGSSARLVLIDAATSVDYVLDLRFVPKEFALWQNYPNPFNPETRIVFDMPRPENGSGHLVRLEIYNMLGQKIRTLVDEEMAEGRHEVMWDGRDEDGREVTSGVYFYRLRVGDKQFGRRMMVVR
jgi:PKD repeat protein